MTRSVFFCSLFLWVGFGNAAAGEARRTFDVEGVLGLGTPVGLVGGQIAFSPHPNVVFSAGAGQGLTGIQIAAMPKVRVSLGTFVMEAGLGASSGKYSPDISLGTGEEQKRTWDWATWTNAEVAAGIRRPNGFHARFFVGFSYLLNKTPSSCEIQSDRSDDGSPCPTVESDIAGIPYVGVASGWAF